MRIIPPSRPAGPTGPGAQTGKRTLRRGMSGLDVARCQNLLNSWMVAPERVLWVDGMFGQKTHTAVCNFQRRVRIQVDGVVGPQTWAMLEA